MSIHMSTRRTECTHSQAGRYLHPTEKPFFGKKKIVRAITTSDVTTARGHNCFAISARAGEPFLRFAPLRAITTSDAITILDHNYLKAPQLLRAMPT